MVIPIHDDNPVRRVPIITYLLIALNFAVFFTEPVVSQIGVGSQTVSQVCDQTDYFDRWAVIPKELVHNSAPAQRIHPIAGTQFACRSDESGKKPYLSVLYAMFLHGGWLHILGNM